MSGSPMFTPFATPIAMIAGQRRPAASAAARPASNPACVPPLDDVNTIADGATPSASNWSSISNHASAYPSAPVAVLPPIGIE